MISTQDIKLGFISTMAASPWGGSEELWSQTAEIAAMQGMSVSISVPYWKTLHLRLQRLQSLGAKLYQRRRRDIPLSLLYRFLNLILHKIGLELRRHASHLNAQEWERSFPNEIDLLIISQGGVFCGVREVGLIPWLENRNIPYIIVCQVNDAHLRLNDSFRQKTLNYLSHAQRIAFVSENNKHIAQIQLASPLSNSVIVQNPLNLEDISLVPWPSTLEPLNLACVARLDIHAKGQDLIFQALSQPQWQHRNYYLNLYGTGEDRDYLERLANYLGIHHHIIFHGHVQNIRNIWERNHILILPSHYEGSALSLLEAMTCGRPAVVTEVGSNFDLIHHHISGFRVTAPTVDCLSKALEEMWNRQKDLRKMGETAREIALSHSFHDAPSRLLEIIRETIAENSR